MRCLLPSPTPWICKYWKHVGAKTIVCYRYNLIKTKQGTSLYSINFFLWIIF